MNTFYDKIEKFNKMYNMPENGNFNGLERFENFQKILEEELKEGPELLCGWNGESSDLEFRTNLSDWLGDIIVYCASEAKRWGLPLEQILDIIMESNFSKLDENGNPIYDSRGKVMKGPNYWKPEPKIKELLK